MVLSPSRKFTPFYAITKKCGLIITKVAKTGSLSTRVHFALDEKYWRHLFSVLGNYPSPPIFGPLSSPSTKLTWEPSTTPPNSTQFPQKYSQPTSTPFSRTRATSPKTPLPRSAMVPPWHVHYNVNGVGKTKNKSLVILNLTVNMTEIWVKTQYCNIARI